MYTKILLGDSEKQYSLEGTFLRYDVDHDMKEFDNYIKAKDSGTMSVAEWMLEQFINSPIRIIPYAELPEHIKTKPHLDIKYVKEYGYTCAGYEQPILSLTKDQFWDIENLFCKTIKQYLDIDLSSLMKYTSSGEFGSAMGLNGWGLCFRRSGNILKLRQYFKHNQDPHIV